MQEIFEKLVKDIVQPAIIIDKNKNVLYVNTFFTNKFLLKTDKQSNLRTTSLLNSLNIESLDDKSFSDIKFTVLDQRERINVSVYRLNTKENLKNIFLVLCQTNKDEAEKEIKPAAFNTEESLDTDILEQEFKELIGRNIAFKRALALAQRAAKSNISVLITGESGTGKEILARAIHKASTRFAKPLIDVNCAAIPDTLIESELFGYEKGAFTGAKAEGRKGYFDEAHEGTILLDEIGDASLQTQSKLLRVLEEGTFKRVGGTKNIKVDVRIISSTNRDLTALIEQKKFREDLFFRLNAFTIFLPPLRQRKEDIELLVDHFLKSNSDIANSKFQLSSSAMDILNSYNWPGNVRELKGVVSYAVNMSANNYIRPNSLPNFLFAPGQTHDTDADISSSNDDYLNLVQATEELEKKLIRRALEQTSNKSMAIKKLGISRRTFYQKIKKYGLDYKAQE